MSWQKIAEDSYNAYWKANSIVGSFGKVINPASKFSDQEESNKRAWELAARQAVWSYQMGMLQKEPELMVVLTPEMKQ